MKKVLKITGISLLTLVIIVFVGVVFIVYKFSTAEPEIMTPEDYETTVSTGGALEEKYLAHGHITLFILKQKLMKYGKNMEYITQLIWKPTAKRILSLLWQTAPVCGVQGTSLHLSIMRHGALS